MKPFLKPFLLINLLIISNLSYSNTPSEVFSIDEEKINVELSGLNNLENYIVNHPSADLTSLKAENTMPEVVNKLSPLQASDLTAANASPGGLFVSFLAGFCCGVPGIAIVFFASQKDLELTQTSIIGGVVGFALIVIIYLIAISSSGYYYY